MQTGDVTDEKKHAAILQLEYEVDRQHLCDVLLEREEEEFLSTRLEESTTQLSKKSKKSGTDKKKKSQPVVAACYVCDFEYIVIGHTKKKNIVVHNVFEDTVALEWYMKLFLGVHFAGNLA